MSFLKLFIFFTLLFVAFTDVTSVSCKRPSLGRYVVGKDGMECVALIKENCVGMRNKNTRMWRRGVHIRDNCSIIRPMSAIATFSGPNNKYGGGPFRHAAIFASCDVNGIWVYDQWNGSRGVLYRQIPYNSTIGHNNGSNYYTITL
ncbi:unnamed protein product [Allacma fusca]|uniref:Uncharacterized protein n=1 Tax=Allacma fusca TaxID=39272 RepID=A0A8J2LL37_9HEXA|nr:unnamed protein product [Allacma fusca]